MMSKYIINTTTLAAVHEEQKRKGNVMIAKVIQNREVELEQYFVLRGVKVTDDNRKIVVDEKEFKNIPTKDDIAQFMILNPKIDFCSTEVNYRILGVIPEEVRR